MLSIESKDQHQGRSLLGQIEGAQPARPVFSEYPLRAKRALLHGDHKLMTMERREEYYDLRSDPREQNDLGREAGPGAARTQIPGLAELRRLMAELAQQNERVRRELGVEVASEVPGDTVLEQLRALGYIDDSASPSPAR